MTEMWTWIGVATSAFVTALTCYFFLFLPAWKHYTASSRRSLDAGLVAGGVACISGVLLMQPYENADLRHLYVSAVLCSAVLVTGMAAAAIDQACLLIPDRMHVAGWLLSLTSLLHDAPSLKVGLLRILTIAFPVLICSVVVLLIGRLYQSLRGLPPMGFGDIKLISWLGIWANGNAIYVIGIASVSAWLVSHSAKQERAIAFAPYLCISALVVKYFSSNAILSLAWP